MRRTIFLAAAALGGAASGSALGPSKAADRVATHDFLYRRPGHGARARSAASAGLLAGAATRLLFDARQATTEATATAVGLALAPAQATAYATAWIAGFPRGSGLVLIHHRALFDLLDTWLGGLAEEVFREIVPLLRRAFAGFSAPGRRQLLELAGAAPAAPRVAAGALAFDWARGARVLPVLRQLMGAYIQATAASKSEHFFVIN